jgi:hypothetical protein
MRVDWVHPSWRDLVIDSLAADADARRYFLARCGVDGAALALAERDGRRPLLQADADWDALGDGLYALCHDLDEVEATQVLVVLAHAGDDAEVLALAQLALERLAWAGRRVGVDALTAWLVLAVGVRPSPERPDLDATWRTLEPADAPRTPDELERFVDWLRLVELLAEHAPRTLDALGWPSRHAELIERFTRQSGRGEPPVEHDLRLEALQRIGDLAPKIGRRELNRVWTRLSEESGIPTVVRVGPPPAGFPVERVLRDLG